METGSAWFGTTDGVTLCRRRWLPEGTPLFVVAVVHGYGEHGGRYAHLAASLTPLGAAVHVYDLRGHGRSGGRRGHVDRFARYIDDIDAFLAAIAAEHPGAPLFLLGHSLGGVVAALYAEEVGTEPAAASGRDGGRHEVPVPRGLALSSPFLALGMPVPGLKLAAARLLARVAPTWDIGNTLRAADLSHDVGVVAAYGSDPLNHHVATARWAVETLAAQRQALAGAPRLRLPLLVLYGTADRIAAPQAARRLFDLAASADKSCLAYEGYYHELFNETGKERPMTDLAGWLRARVTAPLG